MATIRSKFERFKTFEDMKARALAIFSANRATECYMEPGIYTDNNGTSFRPEVRIVFEDNSWIGLRWYAYAEEEGIDFYDRRQRVDAHNKALMFIHAIKQERDTKATAQEVEERQGLPKAPEGWQQVDAGPQGTSLDTITLTVTYMELGMIETALKDSAKLFKDVHMLPEVAEIEALRSKLQEQAPKRVIKLRGFQSGKGE